MKHNHCPIVLIFILAASALLHGAAMDSLWSTSEQAYQGKRYEEAVNGYSALLREYPHSVPVMYNLANSYLQQGDLGNAILWYERALRYKPVDRNIRHNLRIAQARRENAMISIRQFFIVRWARGLAQYLTPIGWGVLSVLFFWVAIGMIAFSMYRDQSKPWRTISIVGGALFILSVSLGMVRYNDVTRNDVAIVTGGAVEVRIAPDEESKQVTLITSGEKVFILDSLDNYWKVRLVNYEHGWVPVNSVERL